MATAVTEEILGWSQGRPLWQRDALRRLFVDGIVPPETIERYAKACLGEGAEGLEPLAASHIQLTGPAPPVRVTAIHATDNVNALAPGKELSFGAEGLTVVYGDNGSGKSGYARILKQVTRTRASETVRNDIFRGADLVPTAIIEFKAGDDEASFSWVSGEGGPDELSRVSFFDHACTDIYISRDTEVAFRPFGLSAFDGLVRVCEEVREHLGAAVQESTARIPGLPTLNEHTAAGKFLASLNPTTGDPQISAACTFTIGEGKELAALEEAAAAALAGQSQQEAKRLGLLADRTEALLARLETIAHELSPESDGRLATAHEAAVNAAETARRARDGTLTAAPLSGVGETAWRALWDAARKFSNEHAYPDRDFPVVEDGRCVLCQQLIDEAAAERIQALEAFIHDTTQQAADAAAKQWQRVLDRVRSIVVADEAITNVVADIASENDEVGLAIEAYLKEAADHQAQIEGCADAGNWQDLAQLASAPLELIASCADDIRQRIAALGVASEGGSAEDAASRVGELRDRRMLADAVELVFAQRDRLARGAAATKARALASTNTITAKAADLTDSAVTEVLADRFSRETDRLGLENVVLRSIGGRKGVLRFRTGFVGAVQDAPLPEVLSEGEQTALGTAGFLAEVWTDPSGSAVVFDDPVSSLDHGRRDHVAQRIVGLAKDRQVIVFTHDVAFVHALKRHATKDSVPVTERSVERAGSQPGHTREDHKFSAKLVKERLAELRDRLEELRRASPSMTMDDYRDATEGWYRLLRRTWERAIEETLLGDILTRDDLEVHPTMVRTLIAFTPDDNKELQYGYGRASEFFGGHDESGLENRPAPKVDELEADLEALTQWHKRISGRRNLSEDKLEKFTVTSS